MLHLCAFSKARESVNVDFTYTSSDTFNNTVADNELHGAPCTPNITDLATSTFFATIA